MDSSDRFNDSQKKKTPPRSVATATTDEMFDLLIQQYTNLRMKNDGGYKLAMDMLFKKLDSPRKADRFFKWAEQRSKDTSRIDDHRFTQMSNSEFRTHLSRANWREGGSALSYVNTRLFRSSNNDDTIPLGRINKDWLALQPDSAVMVAQQTDFATLEVYEAGVVNPINTLGACYTPNITTPNKGKQTLIFAQLGKILSTCINGRQSDIPLVERHWHDTGFILALEILESGLSAGKFYMICNLTWQDDWAELSDDEIYDRPWLLRLCEGVPPFTVAQIEGQGLGLIKDSWDKACEEDEKEIQLKVMSDLRPEIVETGLLGERHDGRLIAFFANPGPGGI